MPKNNYFLACSFLFQSFSIALFLVYNLYKIKMQLTAQPRTKNDHCAPSFIVLSLKKQKLNIWAYRNLFVTLQR